TVTEDEVPRPSVVARYVLVAALGQYDAQSFEESRLERDVEVCVAAGLRTQQRVDCPASVDPDVDALMLEQVVERYDVPRRHVWFDGRGAAHRSPDVRALPCFHDEPSLNRRDHMLLFRGCELSPCR